MMAPDGAEWAPRPRVRWRKMLDEGVHETIEDLAKKHGDRQGIRQRHSSAHPLTLLATEIVEAILDGRQPVRLQLDHLLEGFSLEWKQQAECWARSRNEDFRS